MKSKPEIYVVKFQLKNKQTGEVKELEEEVYSFSKTNQNKAKKEIENKYRGQGYKVTILSIL